MNETNKPSTIKQRPFAEVVQINQGRYFTAMAAVGVDVPEIGAKLWFKTDQLTDSAQELLKEARIALGLMLSYHGQGSADYADVAQVKAQEIYDAIDAALAARVAPPPSRQPKEETHGL